VTNRWGEAGERLTDEEIAHRNREAVRHRNQSKIRRDADEAIARRLWAAGELKPYLITYALDAMGLYGPEVDLVCGAEEPDVDLWEAGKLYPTWEQLVLLAKLVGKTPRFLCSPYRPLQVSQTSMRFHIPTEPDAPPPVWSYPPEVVAATVGLVAR